MPEQRSTVTVAPANESGRENTSDKSAKGSKRPNAVAEFGKAHEKRIEDAAPELIKKLVEAREDWEAAFWEYSGLGKLKKAAPDEPLYFDDDDQPLTYNEAAALKQVVQELSPNGWSQALYDELTLMLDAGFVSANELLKAAGYITTDFEVVPSTTLDAIRQKAEQFAFMVNNREQQTLFDVIDTAVTAGQTPKELAGVIADTFKQGYHVTTLEDGTVKRFPTDVWSKMVARTELARAQTMGNMALYQTAGIKTVMWCTSQGANVCDECEDLDGDVFDLSDVSEPPLHPNCACALTPADEDVAYHEPAA